jgi:hypothetical protein
MKCCKKKGGPYNGQGVELSKLDLEDAVIIHNEK